MTSPLRFGTDRGFSLLEVAVALIILAIVSGILVTIGGSLMDANRSTDAAAEMARIYTAVVGDPSKNFYGYVGDTGDFPTSLMDLVRDPGGTVYGWNGPYLNDARVEGGVLYDTFGAPYECYRYSDNTQSVADQFAIMSRGPDRSTSNAAPDNSCTTYNDDGSIMPSTYAQSGDDGDNVVYPRFADNSSLLNYNQLGTLSITIFNFDRNPLVNTIVPGCPHLYTIRVTSASRGTNDEFSMPYAPGANSVDLPQGLYNVQISSPHAQAPIWKDQVAITPGATVSRTATVYTGLNSGTTPTQWFAPVNGYGATLRYVMISSALTTLGNSGTFTTVRACSQIYAQTAATNQVFESFVYPNLSLDPGVAYDRPINPNVTCSLTVMNQNTDGFDIRKQLQVRASEVIIGMVSSRGMYKSKTFLNVKDGADIKLVDIAGNVVHDEAAACSGGTATITYTNF